MSSYVAGTGLVDIDASSVRTLTLQTDSLGSESGVLDCTYNSLRNVTDINGVNVSTTSNVAYTTSNTVATHSNVLFPQVSYASITATHSSNVFHSSFSVASTSTSNLRGNFVSPGITCSNLDITQGVIRIGGSNFVGIDKKVDYNTWIKGGPVFNSNDDTLAIAGLTVGAAGLASALAGQLLSQTGQIGPSIASDIAQRLGEEALEENYDPDESDSNIKVHWNSITYKPFHQNPGFLDIGFGSNVYVNSNASLYSIRSSDLSKIDGGRFKRIAGTPSVRKVIDFAERKFFGTDFSACNFSASNNVTSSDFLGQTATITNTLATSNLQATNVFATSSIQAPKYKTNGLVLTDDGLYSGEGMFATQVINPQGFYQGTISASQVINTESLDFTKLTDGIVSLQSVGEYVNTFGNFAENAFFTL